MMSSVAVSEAFKLEMQLFEISFSGFADQRIRWLDTLGPLAAERRLLVRQVSPIHEWSRPE